MCFRMAVVAAFVKLPVPISVVSIVRIADDSGVDSDLPTSRYGSGLISKWAFFGVTCLLQLRIFCLGLLQDGDVGIGVQPDHKKCCVSLTGFFVIPTELVGATQLQASKYA